jgi:heme exporter protein D
MVGGAVRFESLSDFFHMGGHGVYIWVAYGLTMVVLAANIWWPVMVRRKVIRSGKLAMSKGIDSEKREKNS